MVEVIHGASGRDGGSGGGGGSGSFWWCLVEMHQVEQLLAASITPQGNPGGPTNTPSVVAELVDGGGGGAGGDGSPGAAGDGGFSSHILPN